VTHWDSVGALQAFAGPPWQEAVVEPDEEHMLAEVVCDHYANPRTPHVGQAADDGSNMLVEWLDSFNVLAPRARRPLDARRLADLVA
jgi:hypothetical protein